MESLVSAEICLIPNLFIKSFTLIFSPIYYQALGKEGVLNLEGTRNQDLEALYFLRQDVQKNHFAKYNPKPKCAVQDIPQGYTELESENNC